MKEHGIGGRERREEQCEGEGQGRCGRRVLETLSSWERGVTQDKAVRQAMLRTCSCVALDLRDWRGAGGDGAT